MQQVPWLAAGRYEVGEVVGRGGYGLVYRGVDRQTGRAVALKMLSPEAGRDPDVVERMLREQQALVALRGTCAVTAVDLCRLDSGAPCLVMEWLEGRNLEEQLTAWEAEKRFGDNAQLLAILRPLTQTLERAHRIGIVHRDIKPANIFLIEGGAPAVRLLDFGLSRMKSAAPLTAVGVVLGSPSYIAPETWRGNSSELDGRADLFALGVIVFRWLTGQLPFDTGDLVTKMTAVTSGPRPSAVALRAELPQAVDAWSSRALAIEPSERFQTGGDFCAALEAALRGEVWQKDDPDASGVRSVVNPATIAESPDRRGALAMAWGAAAALLKRFTQARRASAPPPASDTAAAPTPPPAPAAATPKAPAPEPRDDAPTSERLAIWLDSAELEDVVPEAPPGPPPELPAETETAPKPAKTKPAKAKAPQGKPKAAQGKPKTKTKRDKTKATKAKPKRAGKPRAKAARAVTQSPRPGKPRSG